MVRPLVPLLLGIGLVLNASAQPPRPNDLPDPPPGVESPGGVALPAMAGHAADAPAIAAASGTVYPDETIVLTGVDLDGAGLRLWVEGATMEARVLWSSDDRMAAVVPRESGGEPTAASTMLAWPVRGDRLGAPIRINGPDAWWCWPCRAQIGRDETVRVFGKNLVMPGAEPVCVLVDGEGRAQALPIVRKTFDHIEATLPERLPEGPYTLRAHNGTGGRWGWSGAVTFEAEPAVTVPDRTFRVKDYRPHRRERNDVTAAVQRAIDAAVEAGGGTVLFDARTYVIRKPLVLPEGAPIVLKGAGMGRWNADRHEAEGECTVLADWIAGPAKRLRGQQLVEALGRGCRIEDMTFVLAHNYSTGRFPTTCVRMAGRDQTMRRVRCVPFQKGVVPMVANAGGEANLTVADCELFVSDRGTWIEGRTDFVRFTGCRFRGMFMAGRGCSADGVILRDGRGYIVEGCDFRSVARRHGKILSRSVLLYDNGMRDTWLCDNVTRDVGAHPSVPGIDHNISEQYLFHSRGPRYGICTVTKAGDDTIAIDPKTVYGGEENRYGPKLPGDEPIARGEWIALVVRGRGLGQWRVLTGRLGKKKTAWRLDRPWRVTPEPGARVSIMRAFRHHAVCRNDVMPALTDDDIQPDMKAAGVYLYHHAVDNLVMGNRLRRLAVGVAIGSTFETPCYWNEVRANRFERIAGRARATAHAPMVFNDHFRVPPRHADDYPQHAYTLGNAFRANTGRDVNAIGLIGVSHPREWYRRDTAAGFVMNVVEGNRFEAVRDFGLAIDTVANRPIVRRNRFELPEGKPAVDVVEPEEPFAPIRGEDETVIR